MLHPTPTLHPTPSPIRQAGCLAGCWAPGIYIAFPDPQHTGVCAREPMWVIVHPCCYSPSTWQARPAFRAGGEPLTRTTREGGSEELRPLSESGLEQNSTGAAVEQRHWPRPQAHHSHPWLVTHADSLPCCTPWPLPCSPAGQSADRCSPSLPTPCLCVEPSASLVSAHVLVSGLNSMSSPPGSLL